MIKDVTVFKRVFQQNVPGECFSRIFLRSRIDRNQV